MKRRQYKSGSKWAFWRWSEPDNEFILRLHILKTPWFAIALHWIKKPDPEPWLHDHPVSFLSLVLWGSYEELRRQEGIGPYGFTMTRLVWRRWWNWFEASEWDRHSIVSSAPHTLTLCFMGPKRREWGYHTDAGWVHWKEYAHGKYRTAQGSSDAGRAAGTGVAGQVDSPVVEKVVVESVPG